MASGNAPSTEDIKRRTEVHTPRTAPVPIRKRDCARGHETPTEKLSPPAHRPEGTERQVRRTPPGRRSSRTDTVQAPLQRESDPAAAPWTRCPAHSPSL